MVYDIKRAVHIDTFPPFPPPSARIEIWMADSSTMCKHETLPRVKLFQSVLIIAIFVFLRSNSNTPRQYPAIKRALRRELIRALVLFFFFLNEENLSEEATMSNSIDGNKFLRKITTAEW